MSNVPSNFGQRPQTDPGDGAAHFVVLVGVVVAGWLLWTFATTLLMPALSLAGTLAVTTLSGLNGGLAHLATDLAWGVGVGLFVGWMRWLRRKRSGAVETVIEAVASPEIVSSVSLGWMYVALHIGAGLLASIVVWLLGLAFPLQILSGNTDTMLAGLAYLQASGWIAGGGGGSGGAGGEAAFQLVFILLFLLLVLLPILTGLASTFMAISLKGAASGALGAAGKSAGLLLFLVLTRIRGKLRLPRPPTPKPKPAPPPDPGPLDIDRILDDFAAVKGRRAVNDYVSWLKMQGITPDAQTIGQNAPRYKDTVIYELARRVNYEMARRDPQRVDFELEAWKKSTDEDRSHYELRLREEIFGPGWLKRAAWQGLGAGVLTGLLTGLLVAGTLAMLRGQ